mgnify:CR=1 FL=1
MLLVTYFKNIVSTFSLEGEAMLEGGDGNDELEFEMPSKQFFQDIGVLVVEGRVPHPSDKGRVEGPHCPSVLGAHTHTCDNFNKLKVSIFCEQSIKHNCFLNKILILQIFAKLHKIISFFCDVFANQSSFFVS